MGCRADVMLLVVPIVLMLWGLSVVVLERCMKRQWWDTVNAVGQDDIIKLGSLFFEIGSHSPHLTSQLHTAKAPGLHVLFQF